MTAAAHTRTDLAALLKASANPTETAQQPSRRVLRIEADGLACILSLNATSAPVCALPENPKKRVLTC